MYVGNFSHMCLRTCACGGPERVLDPLEVELQETVVSLYAVLGCEPGSSGRTSGALTLWAMSAVLVTLLKRAFTSLPVHVFPNPPSLFFPFNLCFQIVPHRKVSTSLVSGSTYRSHPLQSPPSSGHPAGTVPKAAPRPPGAPLWGRQWLWLLGIPREHFTVSENQGMRVGWGEGLGVWGISVSRCLLRMPLCFSGGDRFSYRLCPQRDSLLYCFIY